MNRIRLTIKCVAALLCLLGIGTQAQSLLICEPEPVPVPSAAGSQDTTITQKSTVPTVQEASISGLPCHIPGTPLTVQAIVFYEGPFLEDNSDEETVCTALIIANTSDSMIEYTRLELIQNGHPLIFEITYLPPQSKVLAVEKNQAPFSLSPIESCTCQRLSFLQNDPFDRRVFVSPDGSCSMITTNLTDRTLDCVRIYYKQYLPKSELYLGGITYSAVLTDLQSGESRRITPYRYLTAQGSIIAVTATSSPLP